VEGPYLYASSCYEIFENMLKLRAFEKDIPQITTGPRREKTTGSWKTNSIIRSFIS
jgi:hypothetical protein